MQLGFLPGEKEPSQIFLVIITIHEVQTQLMSGVPSLSHFVIYTPWASSPLESAFTNDRVVPAWSRLTVAPKVMAVL